MAKENYTKKLKNGKNVVKYSVLDMQHRLGG